MGLANCSFYILQYLYGKPYFSTFCFQLPGIISLSSKFIPTIMNLIKKLAEEGQNPATNNPQRNPSKDNYNAVTAGSAVSSSSSSNITSLDNGTGYTSSSKDEQVKKLILLNTNFFCWKMVVVVSAGCMMMGFLLCPQIYDL